MVVVLLAQVGADKSYEILCKTFDADAKSILEVNKHLCNMSHVSVNWL